MEQCKKFQFLGLFNKNFNSVLSFSTESAKPTIYDFLFLITFYSPKNHNKHPSEMTVTLLYNQVFSGFGTHFNDRPKILTYR